jgi:hypothetical protein
MLQALHGSYPLFFYCLPVGGVALAVVGLLADSVRGSRWLRFSPAIVFPILALAVVAFDLDMVPGSWLALQVLAAVCGAGYVARAPIVSRGLALACAAARNARVQWSMLLVASIISGVLWLYRDNPDVFPMDDMVDAFNANADPATFELVISKRAYSDRGRAIALRVHPPMEMTTERIAAIEQPILASAHEQVIRMSPPDPSYNCHGWTFAGGTCWIFGGDVDVILEDNGYRAVSEPQADDLVVFRNSASQVTHSGIVRTILAEGEFLMESKWGWAGRFLHTARGRVYGNKMTFYRSNRQGHHIHISTEPAETERAGVF